MLGNIPIGPGQSSNLGAGAAAVNPAIYPMIGYDPYDPVEVERARNEGYGQFFSDESTDKFKMLEDRIKAIEGTNTVFGMDPLQLSLVPDLILPPKFKMPEFEKFDGSGCPIEHLTMFARKMTGFGKNDKLLIHCFQDSLTGSATRWYNQLKSVNIRTWGDLSQAFYEQYKYLTDSAPDRTALEGMEKKPNESFKAYAHRWRNMAIQVQPPLTDQELPRLFISTLKAPFYDHMFTNTSRDFSELVTAGEKIEHAVKSGRIVVTESAKKAHQKNEVNAASEYQSPTYDPALTPQYAYQPVSSTPLMCATGFANPSLSQPMYVTGAPGSQMLTWRPTVPAPMHAPVFAQPTPQRQPNYQPRPPKAPTPKPQFTPIPVSYKDLLPQLIERGLAAPYPIPVRRPPYPKWYDFNAHCNYHAGAEGHDTENCVSLKKLVQTLLDTNVLEFDPTGAPNITGNPLPNQTRQGGQ